MRWRPRSMAASSHQRAELKGRRIFVVEDEYFLADDIGKTFRALGAEIAGPVGHLEDALKILHDGSVLDAAVLDVNIRSEMVFPIARELRARNVPFLFTTGYEKITLSPEFQDVPLLEKPIDLAAMAQKLAGLIAEQPN
ncbi:chemotaxis protein CheY [Bradyrhizobium sp. SUTN9-2]|nr:chemotaxis protein CheY [Bradyrhizobium sp. SUTN9-2]